ncbi:hypothetical protein [Sulfitobacter sp. S190]|uniref:hypothetical protein n=1 Tax=Sulfitobacter sp. S190 TaxID=2867022 RepID=UPI0021A6539D|nr:hypothetical protein [Sulfitobacter sp. S190]UWR22883.1 hypothetical protein K3756_02470 [Sulfitobacter sp. S190]
MDVILPNDFKPGQGRRRLAAFGGPNKASVEADGIRLSVLQYTRDSFTLADQWPARLSGVVDFYLEGQHQFSCLITSCTVNNAEAIYTFRRQSAQAYHIPVKPGTPAGRSAGVMRR